MAYTVCLIPKEKQKTSTWSGGTTTELAIYPTASEYKARNFKWRLSSARVEIEESTFTSLPEIWRHIMIIEGEMELQHEGQHKALLKPFEQDSFSGGWVTRSRGKCTDFNLMLGEGCKGKLQAIFPAKDRSVEAYIHTPDIAYAGSADAYYCAAGEAKITTDRGDSYNLCQGDLMLLCSQEAAECGKILLQSTSRVEAAIIRAKISF